MRTNSPRGTMAGSPQLAKAGPPSRPAGSRQGRPTVLGGKRLSAARATLARAGHNSASISAGGSPAGAGMRRLSESAEDAFELSDGAGSVASSLSGGDGTLGTSDSKGETERAERTQRDELGHALAVTACERYADGELAAALELFRESLELAPSDAHTLYNYGVALQDGGHHAEATQAYEGIGLLDGGAAGTVFRDRALFNFGVSMLASQRDGAAGAERARAAFSAVLSAAPDDLEVRGGCDFRLPCWYGPSASGRRIPPCCPPR